MSNSIIKSAGSAISKVGFNLKKYSPEIMVGAGIVGMVGTTIMACKSTTKLSGLLEEHKTRVDEIHVAVDSGKFTEEEYSQKDAQKDLVVVYRNTTLELVKLYGPSVLLGAASIASIIKGHNILQGRNIALAAAFATVDKGFKEYRDNVVERFGEAVDRELKYNTVAKKVTEVEIDEETGKEKKVKRTIEVADDCSMYARFFEEYTVDSEGNTCKNYCWNENPEQNLYFLKAQQHYANDLLRSKKRLFLNDVYKMLGLPETKAGQVVGWVYDENNPVGDNYVSFGVYGGGSQNFSDFIYGTDGSILLDFNVDGNIWELM